MGRLVTREEEEEVARDVDTSTAKQVIQVACGRFDWHIKHHHEKSHLKHVELE